jgi:para-aminobenzoate synthetase component 1
VRKKKTFPIYNKQWKSKLLNWTSRYPCVCYLDSNGYYDDSAYKNYECLVGVSNSPQSSIVNHPSSIRNDWAFGFMTYDLKNEIEKLSSNNFDNISMPLTHFFIPDFVFELNDSEVIIHYPQGISEESIKHLFDEINSIIIQPNNHPTKPIIQQRVSKEEYISTIEKIRHHIALGDIYEMNYCMEFFAEDFVCDPYQIYSKLNQISPTPFSCFYKLDDKFLLCASPERFLMKKKNKIISQPIKGTIRRDLNDKNHDEQLKQQLFNDPKERSENVMIVDLVRNDLSRTAKKGSVKVEELFGIYSFKQVHQMISTVSSEVKEDISFDELIKTTFPMGSMTGAPKIRAMQLIEQYEKTKRGLYSGSVGYISPDNNFDFNVVIRSIIYNSSKKYLSFMVGSAITFDSVPEKEYEECLLKAKAIIEVLGEK